MQEAFMWWLSRDAHHPLKESLIKAKRVIRMVTKWVKTKLEQQGVILILEALIGDHQHDKLLHSHHTRALTLKRHTQF